MANQPPVNPNHDEMRDTLAVCGIDVALANRVIDTNGDGVDSLQSLAVLTGKDVETMSYNAGRRQVNQGGYCLGAIQAKRLKALNWWVLARICEQEEVNGYGVEWTIAACQEAMLLMDIKRTTRERSSSATMPEKFNPDHFTAGILQFQTYLQSFLGVEGTRLDYITRGNDGDPGPDYSTRTEQTVWKASLGGPHYEIDCSDVWTKLKAWTLETAG